MNDALVMCHVRESFHPFMTRHVKNSEAVDQTSLSLKVVDFDFKIYICGYIYSFLQFFSHE